MIAAGRVRSLERDGSFSVQLDVRVSELVDVGLVDGSGALVAGGGLLCLSLDLLDPFAVVGGVDVLELVDGGVILSGRLDDADGQTVATRRVRGLLAGRRVKRFELAGRIVRPVHADLDAFADPVQLLGFAAASIRELVR